MSLATRTLVGLIAGFAVGLAIAGGVSPTAAAVTSVSATLGTLFVNLVRMTVVPLIVSLLIATVGSAASTALGRTGLKALAIAVVQLVIAAVASGIAARAVLGAQTIDREAARALAAGSASLTTTATTAAPNVAIWLIDLVPQNVFKAAADGALLPLLVFSVCFGLALSRIHSTKRQAVLRVAEGVADAMQQLVVGILAVAPAGVFFLAVPLAARLGWSAAGAVASYVGLVVVLTIAAVALLLYPFGIVAGRMSAAAFIAYCAPAQAIAFASRSSLASLPAMLEAAERAKLPPVASTLVLPLAAAVYHFGAAVAQMVGVIFLAQLYGISLTAMQQASVVLAVVVGTFAVPGIPGGSIIAMVPALAAANLPLEGIGILLAVDAIPDMFRTTANVTGSLTLAAVVSSPDRAGSGNS